MLCCNLVLLKKHVIVVYSGQVVAGSAGANATTSIYHIQIWWPYFIVDGVVMLCCFFLSSLLLVVL